MKEQVKELWKSCFNDSEEFTDMYFRLRYRDDINMILQKGDELIAAMQLLPYPMTFCGNEVSSAYISGACTHPKYRNRGYMSVLLQQALTRIQQEGTLFSILIPAESGLFGFYARYGYASIFRQGKQKYTMPKLPPFDYAPALQTIHNPIELYNFFDHKLREKPCSVLHTFADCRVIMADLRLSNGRIFTLKEDGRIVAGALVTPSSADKWVVNECMANSTELKKILLYRICEELEVPKLEILLPSQPQSKGLGMARIINAEAVLAIYARTHPASRLSFRLVDAQIESNNGYFQLQNGNCKKSAKPLTESNLTLSIGELTEKVFDGQQPYMCLMLN
ncbi:MAG: GNAT family N-acetyltransferase [Bacteroides sp.]|nr:GNAT family N-acetyltransferase [Bacteroides sp.]